jgi:hypothetical protein
VEYNELDVGSGLMDCSAEPKSVNRVPSGSYACMTEFDIMRSASKVSCLTERVNCRLAKKVGQNVLLASICPQRSVPISPILCSVALWL